MLLGCDTSVAASGPKSQNRAAACEPSALEGNCCDLPKFMQEAISAVGELLSHSRALLPPSLWAEFSPKQIPQGEQHLAPPVSKADIRQCKLKWWLQSCKDLVTGF